MYIRVSVVTVSQAYSITGNIGDSLLGRVCVCVDALWQKWLMAKLESVFNRTVLPARYRKICRNIDPALR